MVVAHADAAAVGSAPWRLRLWRRTQGAILLLTLLALSGCAATTAMRRGREAELRQDYDGAVALYTRVLREQPGHAGARAALQRARLRASESHFNKGRRLAAAGRLEDAVVEYQVAAELNPSSADVDRHLRDARSRLRARVSVTREGQTALESLVARTRDLPPPGLDLPRDLKLPASLVFREANARDVFTAVARFADLSIVFEPAFRDVPVSIDLRNATFGDAIEALTASTHNFYRVTAPRVITIIPDTPAKRREYEEEVVRTFYVSNAELKEVVDMLRVVIDLRRLAPITATNAITIKDTPERIQAAGRLIAAIDKARPEIVIDVELLEVNRSHLLDYGLQISSPGGTQSSPIGIDGQVTINQDGLTLRDLRNLTQSGIFLSGLPSVYYRLMKSDTSTRTLANPQLRAADGLTTQARFGDKVPVPSTTFSPIATGGVAQQPITQYIYENIGVNIDLTPRTHHNDEVSLVLKLEVSSVSGKGYADLPTFGNRSITGTIRLKDGETSILAGLIRDDERSVLSGMPGVVDVPIVGRLFGRNQRERQQTDIILTLTPHIVRVLELDESDLRPFRIGRDAGASYLDLPVDVPRELPKPIKVPSAIEQARAPGVR